MGISIVLLSWGLTRSAFYDESFHLLAAQLILDGKLPYADFFHQHTPLYAYVVAAWMSLTSESWRAVHALSSLCLGACVMMVARYTFHIVPDRRWKLVASALASAFFGLDILVFRFGTIGQPYALCLLLAFGSFKFTASSADGPRNMWSVLAGTFAGVAMSASLLTVPIAPIELIWLIRNSPRARRKSVAFRYMLGVLVGLSPFLLLAFNSPHAAFFDTIQYHLFHRAGDDATLLRANELRVFTSWIFSVQALVIGILALFGVASIRDRELWNARTRSELILCASLAAGLGLFLAFPYPTFEQYFILLLPFLGVLAAVGAFAFFRRLLSGTKPAWIGVGASALFLLGLAQSLRTGPHVFFGHYWNDLDEMASRINSVTPRGGLMYADDGNVYFASRRRPAPGLENGFGSEMSLPSAKSRLLRVVPQHEVDSMLAAGRFSTVAICSIQDRIDSLGLPKLYLHRDEFSRAECSLFWGLRHSQAFGGQTMASPARQSRRDQLLHQPAQPKPISLRLVRHSSADHEEDQQSQ